MLCLNKIDPFLLVSIAVFLGFIIFDSVDSESTIVIGSTFSLIGSVIVTLAAQKVFLQSQEEKQCESEDIKKELECLYDKVHNLELRIKR